MTSIAVINAAPREIMIAGQKYRITPLSRRELAEFVAWVQDQEFAAAKRQAADMTETERQRFLDRVWDKVSSYSMAHPAVGNWLITPEGAAKAVWLGLRHEHPDMTEDRLFAMMNDPQALADAIEGLEKATASGTPSKKKPRTYKARKKVSR